MNKTSYLNLFKIVIIAKASLRKEILKLQEGAHKNYKKYRTDIYHREFIALRSEMKTQIAQEYRNFINLAENTIFEDSSKFWNFIRDKKGNSRIPGLMKDGDRICTRSQEIVDSFSEYFSSVYNKSDKNLAEKMEFTINSLTCVSLNRISENNKVDR